MRNAFAQAITEHAAHDGRVVLLSGDIGNNLFNGFKERFGERFFNCGVAEANMTSIAAGMAMGGLRPVTYTITPFNTTRCLEQIKVDICYHGLPVIIVGTGSGLSYAGLGATHYSLEDIAQLRSLPNMTVICAADRAEVRLALAAALRIEGPCYLRIGKKNEPDVHRCDPVFEIGRGIEVEQGGDCALVATGNAVSIAMEVRRALAERSLSAAVVSMHTIKPLDEQLLERLVSTHPLIATIEEHSLLGGLGSAVAEWMVDSGANGARLVRFGTADRYPHKSGDQTYTRELLGISPEQIMERLRVELQRLDCLKC